MLNIIEQIEKKFGEIRISGDEVAIRDPNVANDNFHLSINIPKKVWRNNKTGEAGSLAKLLGKKRILKKEMVEVKPPEPDKVPTHYFFKDEIQAFYEAERDGFLNIPAFKPALAYLHNKRNIPEKNFLNLAWIMTSKFLKRIFIPFYEDNKLVWFTTRSYPFIFDGKEIKKERLPKYMNPKGWPKKGVVYNIDKITNNQPVFVFEGVMDALKLEDQIGTSSNGLFLDDLQIEKILKKNPSKIILVPDKDQEGKEGLEKNILNIKKQSNIDIFIYDSYKGKDFGEDGATFINENKCRSVNKKQGIFALLEE